MLTLSNPTEAASEMTSYPARPRKVAPMHPGKIAAGALEDAGVSPRQAALAMDMTPQNLGKILGDREAPITPETALRFAAYFGGTPEHWLRMQADYDLWHAAEKLKAGIRKIKPLSRQ